MNLMNETNRKGNDVFQGKNLPCQHKTNKYTVSTKFKVNVQLQNK